MLFSIRRAAVVALSFSAYANAGPIVHERGVEIQERATTNPVTTLTTALPLGNAASLLSSIAALTATLNTAQAAVAGLATTGGVTVATVGVRTLKTIDGFLNN